MFCSNCGKELLDGAKFCMNCGAKVVAATTSAEEIDAEENMEEVAVEEQLEKIVSDEPEDILDTMTVKKKKWGDKATDKIASKINKGETETIRVELEDILKLVKEHFIDNVSDKKELKKLKKGLCSGSAMTGRYTQESVDGRYKLSVKTIAHVGSSVNVLHPGDSNTCTVLDCETLRAYKYGSLSWGKFKKGVKELIESAEK
ncbi:MAG: zinc ribbon domain-containing protein [Clostridiales bacterium]|nr:zinc ribbon domain-containing protein [Clostridiales bacterium]